MILRYSHFIRSLRAHIRRRAELKLQEDINRSGPTAEAMPSTAVKRRLIPSKFSTPLAFIPDVLTYASFTSKSGLNIGYKYPGDFKAIVIPVSPALNVSAVIALQQDHGKKPLIILTAGIFVSKYQRTLVTFARRAFYKWGYSVMVVEMRDFADTASLSAVPLSGSIFEGQDINRVCDWLRETYGITEIYASGYSYGASCLLSAAAGPNSPIRKIVAFSPFMDIASLLFTLDNPFEKRLTSLQVILFYNALFFKMCAERKLFRISDMNTYVNEVVCRYYDLSRDEFLEKASPENLLYRISVPVLIIHPADDPVISYRQSYVQKLRLDGHLNTTIRFLFPSHGGHYANWLVSPGFTESTLKAFFEESPS